METAPPLLLLVALPFAASLLTLGLPRYDRNPATWLAGIVTLACVALTALSYGPIAGGGVIRQEIDWIPSIGLSLTLRMDGFAWLFSLLVSAMAFLIVVYTRYYISPEDSVRRFYLWFLAFTGAMLGIVLSGNLILVAFFWELTSLFSFLLIAYWHQNQAARDGARMAWTITALGGLALLVGLVLIGHIVGSYDLDTVLASGDRIRQSPLYLPALVLILLGTLTKSAQFPFHFWLPNAMAAPTPVSAFLHSATLVKAGVFLMARLWPVLSNTPEWFTLVGLAGMASLLLGAYLAMFQQDLKGLLAYSTISHLGLITMLLSLGSGLGLVAAIFHMVNHATFKASLFMAAGIIDHETGTRDLRRLGGLFRYMPITGTLATVAAAAMAGVPLLNGFISKEMFFSEAAETHAHSLLDTAAPYVAVIASAMSVTYAIRLIHAVFWGSAPESFPREPHEAPFWMRFPIALLVLACLIVGIIPAATIGPYLATAVSSVLGAATPYYSLAVWHGFTIALIMSVAALFGGTLIYLIFGRALDAAERPALIGWIEGQRIFERVMVTLSWRWARFLEAVFGTRRLQPQLRVLVAVTVFAGAFPLVLHGSGIGRLAPTPADIGFVGLWVVGVASALAAAAFAKFHRFAALVLLGATGLVTSMTFLWLSAPDLALTQLVVEIVTTVLLLLGLRWLPQRQVDVDEPSPGLARLGRLRDLVIAVASGLGVAVLAYAAMSRPLPESIAHYFLENAYSRGGGRNVVNVILVDFRAFDTLGEITVLAVVALSVFALLRRFRPAPESVGRPEQQRIQRAYDEAEPDRKPGMTAADFLLVPSITMRWMFPVVIVLAAYLLLRGHDAPGGGFIAGVTMAAGFILQYMAGGTNWVEARLRILPVIWIGSGLLVAVAAGLGGVIFGRPFLTSHFSYLTLPVLGKIPLASAMLFDLGVFLLVVGATVLMLIALAHQSVRRLRAAAREEEHV